MSKTATKQALVASTILFTTDDSTIRERIDPNLPHNFVDIISLDGLEGAPVSGAGGSYDVFVKTSIQGGFKALTDNGNIPASSTGGDAAVDGTQVGASFLGNPIAIKVVPNGITTAVAYKVVITQNLT